MTKESKPWYKRWWAILLFVIVGLVIIGSFLSNTSNKSEVTCNKPYILVGTSCCLDNNDNHICDNDETTIASSSSQTQTPSQQASQTPMTPGNVGYSITNPASTNTPLTTSLTSYPQDVSIEVTLLQFIRGADAWAMIEDANMFNDQPEDTSKEYVLAKIRFKVISTSDGKAYSIPSLLFNGVSNGVAEDSPFIVEPEPSITKEIYPGATHEGWVTLIVNKADQKPLLRVSYVSIDDELWFKLY